MGKAAKVGLYIGGGIVLFFGVIFMAYGLFGVSQLIGWGVMMFALIVILIGVGMLYLGHRQKSDTRIKPSTFSDEERRSAI